MDTNNRSIIINRTKCLIDSKLTGIYREHGDIWFKFEKENGRIYVLLLQTFFRLCSKDRIIVTDTDKYRCTGNDDDFEWDKKGANTFDRWLDHYGSELIGKVFVKNIEMNAYGDFTAEFSDASFLTVYIETTNDTECWRFFDKEAAAENDLIVLGNSVIS